MYASIRCSLSLALVQASSRLRTMYACMSVYQNLLMGSSSKFFAEQISLQWDKEGTVKFMDRESLKTEK